MWNPADFIPYNGYNLVLLDMYFDMTSKVLEGDEYAFTFIVTLMKLFKSRLNAIAYVDIYGISNATSPVTPVLMYSIDYTPMITDQSPIFYLPFVQERGSATPFGSGIAPINNSGVLEELLTLNQRKLRGRGDEAVVSNQKLRNKGPASALEFEMHLRVWETRVGSVSSGRRKILEPEPILNYNVVVIFTVGYPEATPDSAIYAEIRMLDMEATTTSLFPSDFISYWNISGSTMPIPPAPPAPPSQPFGISSE